MHQIQISLQGLIDLFLSKCSEKSTLKDLQHLVKDEDRWIEPHALFSRIRAKTLKAIERKDHLLATHTPSRRFAQRRSST